MRTENYQTAEPVIEATLRPIVGNARTPVRAESRLQADQSEVSYKQFMVSLSGRER